MRAVPQPAQLVDAACAVAGGNPLLLEQMVRIYHDKGVLEEVTALSEEAEWRVNLEHLASVELPMTVEDAVNARLTALDPPERQILEQERLIALEREESDLRNQRATVVWVFERTGRSATVGDLSPEEQQLDTLRNELVQQRAGAPGAIHGTESPRGSPGNGRKHRSRPA